jgi:hypothetical protein
MRIASVLAAALASAGAIAQTPDLSIQTDLRYTVTAKDDGGAQGRWYDPMGRHSTVGLRLLLEPGLRALVTQRLQKIDGDPDRDLLDEAYVEDPGRWRIGKQYLPFGSGRLLRESAPALRGDGRLAIDALPVQVAVCDAGAGLTRGVTCRAGGALGVSFAAGDHFGVSGTNLTAIRRPEEAPARGGGYRMAAGLDFRRSFGPVTLDAEGLFLRRPHREGDKPEEVSDLRATFHVLDGRLTLTAAWARAWTARRDVYRMECDLLLREDWWLTGFLRLEGGRVRDLALGARVKL